MSFLWWFPHYMAGGMPREPGPCHIESFAED